MDKHVRILGFLNLAWGLMGLLACLVVLVVVAGGFLALGISTHDEEPLMLAGIVGLIFMVITAISTIPSLLAGYGLLKQRQWGRVVAIVVGVLNLFAFPLGTALGGYTLVILLHGDSNRIFDPARQQHAAA